MELTEEYHQTNVRIHQKYSKSHPLGVQNSLLSLPWKNPVRRRSITRRILLFLWPRGDIWCGSVDLRKIMIF